MPDQSNRSQRRLGRLRTKLELNVGSDDQTAVEVKQLGCEESPGSPTGQGLLLRRGGAAAMGMYDESRVFWGVKRVLTSLGFQGGLVLMMLLRLVLMPDEQTAGKARWHAKCSPVPA